MCGIFGYVGQAPEATGALITNLSQLLRHRGPDDEGFESGPGWGLGFRRLSILDLSELGHQPMSTPDGRFWLVFNGEIYNYVELRRGLEQQGERFRGTSDSEILLRLLAREGPKALEHLNGMFALALIDTEQGTYFLARDRLGIKPLYYQARPGQLRFASELKGLLAWPDASREINPVAVAEYLAMEYLPSETCIFKGYQKLPPGYYLTGTLHQPERAEPVSYWKVEINGEEGDGSLTNGQLEDLHNLLASAVQIRLRSDVPVGIFLSGGIDSGLVAALAAKSTEGTRPLALTVSFSEKRYDETDLAQATVEKIGLEQRIIPQRPTGLTDVDRLAWTYDEPFADPSAIPTFTLCEAAAEHAVVFLAGDGGDEAFGGYGKYIKTPRYKLAHAIPNPAARALHAASAFLPSLSSLRYRLAKKIVPEGGLAAALNQAPTDPAFELILPADMKALAHQVGKPLWQRWEQYQGNSITARQQWVDYAVYLPDDILVKVDRASMAHSIEIRSPFLDYRVVEWAARLPRANLLNSHQGKLPLRTLANSLLPTKVQSASKRGFGAPIRSWFRQPFGQTFARERLLSDQARQRGLWDLAGVERLIEAHANGGRDLHQWLWSLLMLDAWARHYLDSKDFLQGPPKPNTEQVNSLVTDYAY